MASDDVVATDRVCTGIEALAVEDTLRSSCNFHQRYFAVVLPIFIVAQVNMAFLVRKALDKDRRSVRSSD